MAKTFRARLIRGKYHENVVTKNEDGTEKVTIKTYNSKTRPVITSTTDLVKTYGREMFEPLAAKREEEEPVVEQDEQEEEEEVSGSNVTETGSGYEFDKMTIAQLKELAAAEEIDLLGATKKDEIITVLTEALESQK